MYVMTKLGTPNLDYLNLIIYQRVLCQNLLDCMVVANTQPRLELVSQNHRYFLTRAEPIAPPLPLLLHAFQLRIAPTATTIHYQSLLRHRCCL